MISVEGEARASREDSILDWDEEDALEEGQSASVMLAAAMRAFQRGLKAEGGAGGSVCLFMCSRRL
jgi:hypothetical protein